MATAKDIMHPGAQWIYREEMLDRAAQLMRELDVGALPVSDQNERLCGIITDRDIVVKCVALGRDPSHVSCAELCEVLHEMESRRIRRMPVVENKRLVGMISEADLAAHLSERQLGEFVERICAG